ncbi:zinc ribbon domain-containing protein [Azorhizophilus paspali]|uniref:zinc ribbon domain-containing protein n=1 Tax=Azorhizophilus paspali TaxID=69963 RepID=UPI003631EF6C
MRGGEVVVADRWFASSKTCSCCGQVRESLPLAVRTWTCPDCQARHDRDGNAAINLKHYAVSSTVSACGGRRWPWRQRQGETGPVEAGS